MLSCIWFCGTGVINTTLKIPFGGYAIGQFLDYSIHVQNQSKVDIYSYTVQFICKITFTAQKPKRKTRVEKKTLYKNTYNIKCLRLTNRIFNNSFPIHDTPASTEGDAVIGVDYLLTVTLNTSSCSTVDSISIPIFIGDVPFNDCLPSTEPLETDCIIAPTVEPLPEEI